MKRMFTLKSGAVIVALLLPVFSSNEASAGDWTIADDGCKVWLNGKQVFRFVGARGSEPDQDAIPVQLKRGWNTLVLKVEQFTGGWSVYTRMEEVITGSKDAEDWTVAAWC